MSTSPEAKRVEDRFLAACLILFGILAFFVIRQYIYYIIAGTLLVFAFFPIHRRIRRRVKNKALASFITFMLVLLVVVGPLVLVGFLVFQDAVSFAKSYDPGHLNKTIQPILVQFGIGKPAANESGENYTSSAANALGTGIKRFAEKVGSELLSATPGLAVGLMIAAFVIYYGFQDGEHFYSRVRHVVPLPDEIEDPLFREIGRVTQVVFVGNILVSVVGGTFGALTFFIFGVPNPVFWGFIMIILGILPIVGAPVVWIPTAAWMYVSGHKWAALGIAVTNLVLVVGYLDHILRPRLIGKFSNIHPVLVLIGVLGGVEVFGALGFVMGPLVLAIFIALLRSYTEWHPRWRERLESGSERFHPGAKIEIVHPPPPRPDASDAPDEPEG